MTGPRLLAEHRRQFPALANKLYANYGVAGPMARSTIEALAGHYHPQQEEGPAGAAAYAAMVRAEDALRARLAAARKERG